MYKAHARLEWRKILARLRESECICPDTAGIVSNPFIRLSLAHHMCEFHMSET